MQLKIISLFYRLFIANLSLVSAWLQPALHIQSRLFSVNIKTSKQHSYFSVTNKKNILLYSTSSGKEGVDKSSKVSPAKEVLVSKNPTVRARKPKPPLLTRKELTGFRYEDAEGKHDVPNIKEPRW
jgi:hypothetical protein